MGIVDKGSQTVKGMLAEAEEGEEILSTISGFFFEVFSRRYLLRQQRMSRRFQSL